MSFNSVHTPFHAMQSEFPPLRLFSNKVCCFAGVAASPCSVSQKSAGIRAACWFGRKEGRTDVTTQIDLHFTSTEKAKCKHSVSLALVTVLGSHYLQLFAVYSGRKSFSFLFPLSLGRGVPLRLGTRRIDRPSHGIERTSFRPWLDWRKNEKMT